MKATYVTPNGALRAGFEQAYGVRIKCVHEYVQYKEFGGTRPAGKPVCAKCGKVRR